MLYAHSFKLKLHSAALTGDIVFDTVFSQMFGDLHCSQLNTTLPQFGQNLQNYRFFYFIFTHFGYIYL